MLQDYLMNESTILFDMNDIYLVARKYLLLIILGACISISLPAQHFAFTHATLIDVAQGEQQPNMTVVIRDGLIHSVAPDAQIKLDGDIQQISLEGKYLLPGFTDAHIHIFQSGGLYARPDAISLEGIHPYAQEREWVRSQAGDFLQRYLKCGITHVMDVGGPLYQLPLRDSLNRYKDLASLHITGPLISTYQPKAFEIEDSPIRKINSPEEARALVQKQLPFKPDFIKIWYILMPGQDPRANLPIVEATIDESHKNGLKVAVHATQLQTASLAVEAGCDILVHSVDDAELPDRFVKQLVDKQVLYIPTLIVSDKYGEVLGQRNQLGIEDFTLANPEVIGSLFDLKHVPDQELVARYKNAYAEITESNKKRDATRKANLKKLSDAGARIATGTDAGNIGTQHASSFYQELEQMQAAGLSLKEILRYSTQTACMFGAEPAWGEVKAAYSADLVVLEKDPFQSLENWKNPLYVVHQGQLVDPDTLLQDTPEILAQRQLNGYNARDLEAFLEPYSDSIELYNFPDDRWGKGKAQMREIYGGMFERTPELHCELVNRMVLGNTVIDQERVTGFGEGRVIEAIAIYKIVDGKIAQVYFVRKD